MIIKWLELVKGKLPSEGMESPNGSVPTDSASDGVDIAHKVLAQEAQRRHAELEGLVRFGWPIVQREKMKKRVRKKVWEVVAETFRQPDDTMVEEITERIVEAAENDRTYERAFRDDDNNS